MVRGNRSIRVTAGAAALAAAVTLVASGCSSAAGGDEADGATVRVVASTNVYGDIAKRIGGGHVDVSSIINDPSQDPHSYEASTRTRLAISKADVVIKNGGGYDDFVTKMAEGTDATVLDAVTISGHKAPAGGELNEHVWYDFAAMAKLTDRIESAFAKAEPGSKAVFAKNASAFKAQLTTLTATEKQIAAAHRGAGVAITEPVPLYMLQACGLVNKTPARFSEAVEEGEGVPVGVLDQTLKLFSSKTVKALVYNEQTSGAETEKVEQAAKQNGVGIVPVTETLPTGKNYLSWMTGNLNAVSSALD